LAEKCIFKIYQKNLLSGHSFFSEVSIVIYSQTTRKNDPLPWREGYVLPSSLLPPSRGEIIRKGRGTNFYPLPSVGEDRGEGDKEQFTLSPTLSRPGRGIFFPIIHG
jgi:hypothetical protein